MGLILSMSLSGSIVMLVIMLIHYLLSRGSLVRWKMIWIKIAMLFFLLPIPLLKEWATVFFSVDKAGSYAFYYGKEDRFWIFEDSRLLLNHAERTRVWLLGVILLVALCFLCISIVRYLRIKKYATLLPSERQAEWSEEIQEFRKSLKIRQKIELHEDCYGRGAFTAGMLKPTVILPVELKNDRRQVVLLHELLHVKKRDNIFKILSIVIICVHWFNPLVFFLPRLYDELCELRCDELVLGYLDPAQKKIYAEEILNQSLKHKGRKIYEAAHLGWGKKLTEVRIMNIVDKKKNTTKWKAAAVFLNIVIAIGGYLPVQAYEAPAILAIDAGGEEVGESSNITECVFIPEGYTGDIEPIVDCEEDIVVLYDRQFIDEEGNIYNVDVYEKKACSHPSKVSGEYQVHKKESDGGCIVTRYKGQMCTECGKVFPQEVLWETHYSKCTH